MMAIWLSVKLSVHITCKNKQTQMLWTLLNALRHNKESIFEWAIGCWGSKNCIERNDEGAGIIAH